MDLQNVFLIVFNQLVKFEVCLIFSCNSCTVNKLRETRHF
jgi:hypothetical protein